MKYYLIDTSAFVYAIENAGKTKLDFFQEKALGQAFLYIPQFCITEVLNTFAKYCFRDYKNGKLDEKIYNEWRGNFIKAVHDRNLLYAYDLHRYHNINSDKIFKEEHTTPIGKKEGYLSSLDILIIAMGIELCYIHGKENVTILTRDGRLNRIGNKFLSVRWFE